MKAVAAVLGALCLFLVLLVGVPVLAAASASTSAGTSAACTLDADLDTEALTPQIAKALGRPGTTVPGLERPAEQLPHARTIVATGNEMKVPARGQAVALATALQESGLRNLGSGHLDSLGLFQQRPSQGWGTADEIRTPAHAAKKFFSALLKVPGWQQLTLAQAAQTVQKSAFPDAYARWEPLATALQKTLVPAASADDTPCGPGRTLKKGTKPGAPAGPIPEGTVPAGYTIPQDAPEAARTALRWAMGQLGTLYQWGGHCTNPRGPDPMGRCDCSSLVQQAYAHAGIPLTRTTYTQVNEGRSVSASNLQPGDLLFSRGTAARPEHVGLYMGDGLVINAPRTTRPVRIEKVKDWRLLAVRRVL